LPHPSKLVLVQQPVEVLVVAAVAVAAVAAAVAAAAVSLVVNLFAGIRNKWNMQN
jgi:hypothetical protein